MIDTIKKRKLRWLGHTLKHDNSSQVVLEGIVQEKKKEEDDLVRKKIISQLCGELYLKYLNIKRKIAM